MNATTLPGLRAEYDNARLRLINQHAAAGETQTQAAKKLGVTTRALNNIIQRAGIHWPAKYKADNQ